MAGDEKIADWIADKLKGDSRFASVKPVGSGYLELKLPNSASFVAAAISVQDVIKKKHVTPLFEAKKQPEFVVNVPSKAIWSGSAINFIHEAPAAFGTLGDLGRATRDQPVSSYRNKEYGFFERTFRQHSAVADVTRVYDKVFTLHRHRGMSDFTVALVDAYDMSAEDVRNARDLYGAFDAALKMNSYGSITTAAEDAAKSMDCEAFKLKALLGRLNKA